MIELIARALKNCDDNRSQRDVIDNVVPSRPDLTIVTSPELRLLQARDGRTTSLQWLWQSLGYVITPFWGADLIVQYQRAGFGDSLQYDLSDIQLIRAT